MPVQLQYSSISSSLIFGHSQTLIDLIDVDIYSGNQMLVNSGSSTRCSFCNFRSLLSVYKFKFGDKFSLQFLTEINMEGGFQGFLAAGTKQTQLGALGNSLDITV
jgi:hypothetical protein